MTEVEFTKEFLEEITIIYSNGTYKNFEINKTNEYEIQALANFAYESGYAVFCHDGINDIKTWNGSLILSKETTLEQEKLLLEILKYQKQMSSFYTVSHGNIYLFHSIDNMYYYLDIPSFEPIEESLLFELWNSGIIIIGDCNIYLTNEFFFADDVTDNDYAMFFARVASGKGIKTKQSSLYWIKKLLEQNYMVIVEKMEELGSKKIYLPTKTTFFQRNILNNNYEMYDSVITEGYWLNKRGELELFYQYPDLPMYYDINFTTKPGLELALRRGLEDEKLY